MTGKGRASAAAEAGGGRMGVTSTFADEGGGCEVRQEECVCVCMCRGGGSHLMRFRPLRSTSGGSSLHTGPRLTGLIGLLNMETTSPPPSSPSCSETCQVDTKCGPGRCVCVCARTHLLFFFIIITSQNRIQLHCDASAAAFKS